MTGKKMWLGHARGHTQWVPCPLIDSNIQRNRYTERIQFDNGGGDGRRSNQYQMQYNFAFSGLAHELDGIDAFNKFASGFWSGELVYLAHPANFETNMMSAAWATPAISEQGWAKIYDSTPTYTAVTGPVRTNLVTNPSMEASSGTVTVRTNLVTNPSMESVVPGTVVMRRNLVTNPSFETNTTGWNPNSSTISRDSTTFYAGTASLKIVTSGAGANQGVFSDMTVQSGVVAGQKFSASAWVKAPAGSALRFLVTSTGAGQVSAINDFIATGSWQIVKSENATLGADKNPYIVFWTTANQSITYYMDSAVLEMSSTVGDFFDGSTTDALGWDYAWSGTANASISTAASAATTVRTNLATNPNSETSAIGGAGPGAGTVSLSTTQKVSGTNSTKFVWTSGGWGAQPVNVTVTAGTTYTASFYIFSESGSIPLFLVQNQSNATVASTGVYTTSTVGSWVRLNMTFTPAAGTTSVYIYGTTSSAATYYIDNVLVEASSTLGDFFDGSFQPAGDFSYGWTGTANASTSIQRGATVASYTPSNAGAIASREWTLTGNQSLRIVPTGGSSYAAPGGEYIMALGMTAGNTYTVSATIRLAAAQTGTPSGEARRILFYYKNSAGSYVVAQSGQAPNAAGTTRLSVTAAIPVGATEVFVRLFNGASAGNGDVWWDDLLVEASPIVGAYFDGSVVSADADLTNSWSGTAHASTSLMRGVGVATVSYFNGVAIQSSGWASSGTKSVRVIPTISDTSSAGFFAVSTTVGQTYTAKAKVRLASIQTGTLNGNARKIVAYNSTITTFLGASNQAPNVVGVSEVSVTFVATTTTSNIIFYSGASAGNGDVWFDDLIVVAGTYTGNYFDGNTADTTTYNNAWTNPALPNASTSTQTVYVPANQQPKKAATYTVTNTNQPPNKIFTLVIPPTHTLYFGASGTATGTAGLYVRPIYASDELQYATPTAVTLLDPNGTTRMNTTFNGATYQAVEIYIQRTTTVASTITLVSMMAQLYKTGTTPALPTNHYQGEGSTGLMFADEAIVETYLTMTPPRKGIATTLVEVEAWRN